MVSNQVKNLVSQGIRATGTVSETLLFVRNALQKGKVPPGTKQEIEAQLAVRAARRKNPPCPRFVAAVPTARRPGEGPMDLAARIAPKATARIASAVRTAEGGLFRCSKTDTFLDVAIGSPDCSGESVKFWQKRSHKWPSFEAYYRLIVEPKWLQNVLADDIAVVDDRFILAAKRVRIDPFLEVFAVVTARQGRGFSLVRETGFVWKIGFRQGFALSIEACERLARRSQARRVGLRDALAAGFCRRGVTEFCDAHGIPGKGMALAKFQKLVSTGFFGADTDKAEKVLAVALARLGEG